MVRDERLSVTVYMKNRHDFLDFRDKMAIFSLLLHLWKKQRRFFVGCKTDENGRVLYLTDNFQEIRWVTQGGFIFVGNWGSLDFMTWELTGYEDLRIGEFALHQPIGLPFLHHIVFSRPFETFEMIVLWLNGKHLPNFKGLKFLQDCSKGNSPVSLLRTLDSDLEAQMTYLSFQYYYKESGKPLAAQFVEILHKFSNLRMLRLPNMRIESLEMVLDSISDNENLGKISLKNSLKWLGVHNLFKDSAAKRAAKKFLSTFQNVESFCGFYIDAQKPCDSRKGTHKRLFKESDHQKTNPKHPSPMIKQSSPKAMIREEDIAINWSFPHLYRRY